MATRTVKTKFIGKLKDSGGSWTGSISASSPIKPASVAKNFRKTDAGAVTRCIDGRIGKVHKKLGPQTAGGGPGFSLGLHVATAGSDTVLSDYKKLSKLARGTDFKLGAHVDDHAKAPFCGCGAIDKMPEILQRMVQAKGQKALEAYVKSFTGPAYDPSIYKEALASLRKIEPKSYFPKNYQKLFLGYVQLRSIRNRIEKLVGAHKEAAVIINLVPGSTFDKLAFVSATKGESQAFNYDHWHVVEFAKKIFPRNIAAQQKFILTTAAYNVATAMVLTDGSQALLVRKP